MIVNAKNLLAAESALRDLEVIPEDEKLPKRVQMGNLLAKKGLSLPDVADNLTNMARYSEKEEIRFKANELALKIQGVLNDDSEAKTPVINIQINGEANMGFLNP